MKFNKRSIFVFFFIVVTLLGLYFFTSTSFIMSKYTKEGSKVPTKDYSIEFNNKSSIRYITPEQNKKLNHNKLLAFIFSFLTIVVGGFLAYKKGLLKDSSAIIIKKEDK